MQLVKCGACGANVSKIARACPTCGHPLADSLFAVRVLLILLIGAVIVAFAGRWMGVW